MKYSVIIVAAGSGSRMNLGYNKVYHPLDGNKTILEVTMKQFEEDKNCKQIVVVTNGADYYQKIKKYCGKIVIVDGGETRQESVYNGLFAVTEEVVFVHDGARPYISKDCLNRLNDKMKQVDAAILAIPCKDTIKMTIDGRVEKTLERERLIQAQTPQAFKTTLLRESYQKAMFANVQGTDDASIVEEFGNVDVHVVDGDYRNKKITTIEDIESKG